MNFENHLFFNHIDFKNFFSLNYINLEKFLSSILIVLIFWIASFFATMLIRKLTTYAHKTKTTLDDRLIEATYLPVRYLFSLLGIYFGLEYYGGSFNFLGKNLNFTIIISSLIILVVGFSISRLIKTFFLWHADTKVDIKNVNKTMFIFIRKLLSAGIYAIVSLIILGKLGIDIGPLVAGLGVAGLAVALGLQETLANLFAALFLIIDKSISIGDWIQLEDGTKAYIKDISWRSVQIQTMGGNTIIIPNSTFVGQKISSYDYPNSSFSVSIKCSVAYDSDLDQVESVAKKAALHIIKKENIQVPNNVPLIRFKELADSGINLIIILKVDSVLVESKVKHELIKELIREFREAGIHIPYPHLQILK